MEKQANRRFISVALLSMALLLASSLAVPLAGGRDAVPTPLVWAAAVASILALLLPLWALWRYLQELDEYLRSLQLKAIYFGLAVLLVVVTGWGYFELYFDLPNLGMYWLNPVYWVAYSAAVVFVHRHHGAES
mgnify:FL=1